MISLILWCIAPIFNAICDLVENENFFSSIFYKDPNSYDGNYNVKDEKWNRWWYKRESDDHVKLIFKYRPDAWHLSKSSMLIFMAASAVVAHFDGIFITFFKQQWLNFIAEMISRGLWWSAIFGLFYHKLFRSKTWRK
jgi:hypothetical protein